MSKLRPLHIGILTFAFFTAGLPAGTVSLDIGGGVKMDFVWVPVGGADGRTSVQVGDQNGARDKEPVRTEMIWGPFQQPGQGFGYYLGSTEATDAQWAIITGSGKRGRMPVTGKTFLEIQSFIEALNAKAGQAAAFPRTGDGTPGVIRLPTEAEWEYAARGGAGPDYVATDPYHGDVERHEVFAAAWSSGRAREVGTYPPNPLGLCDMLGNVREFVEGSYAVGGMVGGLLLKGGSYLSERQELRSSARTEQPRFDKDGKPRRRPDAGFRLCISADVFTSLGQAEETKEAMKAENEEVSRLDARRKAAEEPSAAHPQTTPVQPNAADAMAVEGADLLEPDAVRPHLPAGGNRTVPSAKSPVDLLTSRLWFLVHASLLAGWLVAFFALRSRRTAFAATGGTAAAADTATPPQTGFVPHPASGEEIARLQARLTEVEATADKTREENERLKVLLENAADQTPLGPTMVSDGYRFENSLGMLFVPVAGTDVLFSIWDTRVRDYDVFVMAGGGGVKKSEFAQTLNDPVVNVSWNDAKAFCMWLTEKERRDGTIGAGQQYRLPTDAEWSVAVGLPSESGATPKEKDGKVRDIYPWGNEWPPPKGAGNYNQSLSVDSYDKTSPVGSFPANRFGLFDMGGNVWQWCEDEYSHVNSARVVRGGSWSVSSLELLLSSNRNVGYSNDRSASRGFRCVLGQESSP